jgi:hypothetical protein
MEMVAVVAAAAAEAANLPFTELEIDSKENAKATMTVAAAEIVTITTIEMMVVNVAIVPVAVDDGVRVLPVDGNAARNNKRRHKPTSHLNESCLWGTSPPASMIGSF